MALIPLALLVLATPVVPQATQSVRVARASQTEEAAVLVASLAKFMQGDRYQTESQLEILGTGSGLEFNLQTRLRVLTEHPDRFRAEIYTEDSNGRTNLETLILANGDRVWIYRPNSQQYRIVAYEEFFEGNDFIFIGLSNAGFLAIPADVKADLTANRDLLETIINSLSSRELRRGNEMVENRSYPTYQLPFPGDNFAAKIAIDERAASIYQLQVSGPYEGLDLVVTETILSRETVPDSAPERFQFLPPAGAVEVEELGILPFF